MKLIIASLFLVTVLFSQFAQAALQTRVVTELDRFEPFVAHAFHAGYLWVAKSRENLGAKYSLEIYDTAGKLVKALPLDHALRYLQPFGADGVIIVGVSVTTHLTHYTIVTVKGTTFSARTTRIPAQAFADEVAGAPGKLYFTDPGGMSEEGHLGESARTLFTMQGSQPRYLKTRLPGPHSPLLVGNTLYVVEHPSMASGGKYLVAIDLATETATRLVDGGDFTQILPLDGGKVLALTDRDTNEVVLYDTTTKAVATHLAIPSGTPRALTLFGSCLAVGGETTKRVTFLNLKSKTLVGEWDLSGVGEKLYGIRAIAADYATGRIYARSAYPADVTVESGPDRNSIVLAEEDDASTANLCK